MAHRNQRWRAEAAGKVFFFALLIGFLVLSPVLVSLADQVELNSGEVLSGKVVEDTPDHVVLDHDVLGRLNIPRSQVKGVVIGEPEPEPPPPTPLIPGVKSQFDTGASGATGNAETFTYRAALKSEGKNDDFRFKLAAAYYYGSDHDVISRNEYYYELFNEYFIGGGPGLIFSRGRYDWNAFEEWEGRVSASAGVGLLLVDLPEVEVALRTGAGVKREYGRDDLGWASEGVANIELNWLISPQQKLHFENNFYYDFANPGEHRDLASLAYTIKLNTGRGVLLKIGAENEYQFRFEQETKRNDLKYFGALTFEF